MTNGSRGDTTVNPVIAWVNSRLTDVIAAATGVVIGGSDGAVGTGDIIYADSGLTWSIKTAGAQDTILTIDAGGIPDWRVLASTDLPGGATPALTFSTSNSAGVATGYIASDATLAIFDATVPTTIQPDAAAAAGVIAFASRRDHTHGIVTVAPANIGTANAEGASTSFPRADHVHAHPSGLGTDLHHAQSHGSGDHTGGGTPALVFGATSSAGVSAEYLAVDATIAIFDITVPDTIQPDDAAAVGVAAFAARRDHTHGIVAAIAVDVGTANSEGASTSFSRADHVHDHVSGLGTDLHHAQAHGGGDHDFGPGTPALTFSTTNSAGVATGYIATDATLAIFDATVPNTIEPDDAASAGVVAFAARRDHEHAIIAAIAIDIGTANSEGSSTSFSRADHVHNHPSGLGANLHHNQSHVLATITALGPDHTVSGLTAGQFIRAVTATTARFEAIQTSDLPALPTPGTLTISTSNSGTAPHTHTITTSSNPGAAASILSSAADGGLQLIRFGVGADPDTNNRITLVNGATIGQTAGPLLTFDDTGNILKLTGGDLHLNDGTEDKLEIRRSGDVVATRSDFYADDSMGIAAEINVHLFVDALNLTSDSHVAMHRNAETVDGGTEFFRFIENATQYWRWGSVAHGMTTLVPTDVFGAAGFDDTAAGGLSIAGYRDPDAVAGRALVLIGRLGEAADTTKSTAGIGVIHAASQVKSGTTVTAVGSNGNLFAIANGGNTRWIVDAEGDTHRDGTSNTFDAYDDIMLSRAFSQVTAPDNIIDSGFEQFVKYTKDDLIEARILHKSGFYNESRLLRLHNGAIWQLYIKLQNVVNALIKQGIDLEDLELITKGA